jgi:hypothetical protein
MRDEGAETTRNPGAFGRRALLKGGAAGAASLLLGPGLPFRTRAAEPALSMVPAKDRKLLFVFCAHGGAGIIDSFLPVLDSEVGDTTLADTLDVYPASLVGSVSGTQFRFTKNLDSAEYLYLKPPPSMESFLQHHGKDMAIFCHGVSSVNHNVAQSRSLNGAGINKGRTLMEAMAVRYGGGLPLPNCNMAMDGFIEHGVDAALPSRARHEIITAPLLFATGTHGYRGLAGLPSAGSIQRARKVREQLDRETVFAKTFGKSPLVTRYLEQRSVGVQELEKADLIEKLLLADPATLKPGSGLSGGALAAELYKRFPSITEHDVQAQLGLGFLLAYHGISTSITLGFRSDPVITKAAGVVTAPISFDYSHSAHRVTQNVMWGNLADLLDTFISLLKEYDYMGDPNLGKMWDRSLIYVATDFGRSKTRPSAAPAWGSGHDLNNGSVIVSPLVKGDRVYGGVDPKTCLTHGFDRTTGNPDPAVNFEEAALYGALAHVLDIEYPGREDCPVLLRS